MFHVSGGFPKLSKNNAVYKKMQYCVLYINFSSEHFLH